MRTAKKKEHRRQRRRLPSWREYTVIEDGKVVRMVFFVRRGWAAVLCGCDLDSSCREAVRLALEAEEVTPLRGGRPMIIGRCADGSVWYAECHSTGTNVTARTRLFGPKEEK